MHPHARGHVSTCAWLCITHAPCHLCPWSHNHAHGAVYPHAEFSYSLWAIVKNIVKLYSPQSRILLCAISQQGRTLSCAISQQGRTLSCAISQQGRILLRAIMGHGAELLTRVQIHTNFILKLAASFIGITRQKKCRDCTTQGHAWNPLAMKKNDSALWATAQNEIPIWISRLIRNLMRNCLTL